MEINKLFINACKIGDLNLAKQLLETNHYIDIGAEYDDAFISACRNGHIDIAKWFIELDSEKYYVKVINNKIRAKIIYSNSVDSYLHYTYTFTLNKNENDLTNFGPIDGMIPDISCFELGNESYLNG